MDELQQTESRQLLVVRKGIVAFTVIFAVVAILLLISAVVNWRPFEASLDIYVKILSFLGLVLTAAFGIVGRTVEFRTPDKTQISPWGRAILWGSAVSFVVSASSFFVGIYKDNEAAINAANRNQTTLEGILRAANRFDGLSLRIPLEYGSGFPQALHEVKKRLSGQPGVSEYYISGCTSGFPGFGDVTLEKFFTPLRHIDVEVAIFEESRLGSVLARLRSVGESETEISAASVASAIESTLGWRGLSGSNDLSIYDVVASCRGEGSAEVEIGMWSDSFIVLRTPVADLTQWRYDGSITSANELTGKVAVVWTSLFSSGVFPNNDEPGIDSVALAYPPVGIRCFGSDDETGLSTEQIGQGNFVAVIELDKNRGGANGFVDTLFGPEEVRVADFC